MAAIHPTNIDRQTEQPPPYTQYQQQPTVPYVQGVHEQHASNKRQVHVQHVETGHATHSQQFSHQGPVHFVVYPGQESHVTILTQPGTRRKGGNCPVCGVGIVKREFTDFGLLLGIVAFPIGILCCMKMAQHRCSHCKAVFETPPS